MPEYIPPNHPPALIQSIASQETNQSLSPSDNISPVVPAPSFPAYTKRESQSVLPASVRSLHPRRSQTRSTEFKKLFVPYVADRVAVAPATNKKKSLPPLPVPVTSQRESSPPPIPEHAVPPLTDAVNATDDSATSLGTPISVGQAIVKPIPATQERSRGAMLAPKSSQAIAIDGLEPMSASHQIKRAKVLSIQERGGETREFRLTAQEPAPAGQQEQSPSVVEVIADRQEYDTERQIVTATGNVEIRFTNGVLIADRVQVNLNDRVAVAEGEVILTRGEQILRGERFEYYFVQDSGVILRANGEIYQPSAEEESAATAPSDVGTEVVPNLVLSDRLIVNQPLQRITTSEGYTFAIGDSTTVNQQGGLNRNARGGRVNRVRFQADRVDFDAERWTATNARITNDPFSPPELELRAETATYRNIAPLVDEVTLTNSRIVFDQNLSIPTFQDRLIIDRRPRRPGLFTIGYDGRDRGGFFIERGFQIIDTQDVTFELRPQYLLQRVIFPDTFDSDDAIEEDISPFSLSALGLVADLDVTLGERTTFNAVGSFSSLDLDNLADNLRAQVELRQKIGDINQPYDLRIGYKYRERIFNGSLGFRTVNSSFGVTLLSPNIPIGNTGINFNYQASVQNIEARTDRPDLLAPERDDDLVNLTRYQGSASLSRGFMLWQGEALPPTPEEGLRYTPTPIQPYLLLTTGITGVASLYSNGDTQPSIAASIGLLGQLGHFSRPFFDYTGFNIIYSQGIRGDDSPFLFDRYADTQTLSWGITQQIYGPIRIGVQSSLSLSENEQISTDYFIEYSRRTYNILLRYNPVLEVGSISFRISDFNWSGNPGSFDGTDIRPSIRGVTR